MNTIKQQLLICCAAFFFLAQTNAAEGVAEPIDTNTADLMPSVDKDASSNTTTNDQAPSIESPSENKEIPQTEMAGFSRGSVARSIFTTLIDNREPVDKVKQVPQQTNDVFYFTELRDMEGQMAKHRWEFKGKVIAEVNFKVRGPRWRVWSKKSFIPGWSGDWKVSVVNGADEIISEEVIAFTEATEDVIKEEAILTDTTPAGTPQAPENISIENSLN